MDLRRQLARWALARPHILIVDAPGSRTLRWEVEEELDRRRWPVALSPADADILLVVGDPGPELSTAVDVLWSQVPRPRHRKDVRDGDDVAAQLYAAATSLRELTGDTAESADDPAALLGGQGDEEHAGHGEHSEHGGHEEHAGHGEHSEHGGHEEHAGHGEHNEHGGHGEHGGSGHDHHMHHGGEVAGLPMAGTAPDRDGLELDSLQVSLGPVLPGWPTGLVLSASVQGDVLTAVEASWLDHHVSSAHSHHQDDDPRPDVGALDSLARFLVVAGWPAAARRARVARHDLLSDDHSRVRRGQAEASRLAHSVRRSRFLRWSVRRVGSMPREGPGEPGGDVLDRVYRWCDRADGTATEHASHVIDPAVLAELVEGQELASARLIVAGVDIDQVGARSGHGSAHA